MSYTLTSLTTGSKATTQTVTSSDGTVILQTDMTNGVYVSTDSGTTWSNPLNVTGLRYCGMSANGETMVVSSDFGDTVLYVSVNYGGSWTLKSYPISGSTKTITCTLDGTQLFAGFSNRVFNSTTNGDSWTEIVTGVPATIIGIRVNTLGTKVLLQIYDEGVYIGIYSGSSWSWNQYLSGLLTAPNWPGIAMSSDGTKMAVCENNNTLRYSTNGGLAWSVPTGAIASDIILNVAIAQDGSRFTAYSSTTIYTTTNPAATWSSQTHSSVAGSIAGSLALDRIYMSGSGTEGFMLVGEFGFPPVICFRDGSKILTFNPATGREEYTAVENIRPGTLVKTRMSGYVPVCMAGTSTVTIPNDAERTADRLYVCSKDQFPELTEDLYITGHHSILTNSLTDAEREECAEEMGRVYLTEGRCRLPAHISRRTRVYEAPGAVERIWHFALENNDEQMNYGVYANGLLVESCSIWRLRTMVGYTIMDSRSQVYMTGEESNGASVGMLQDAVRPIVC